jgi:aminoglycoside phosphotransferase (APT) family kinase protein
MGSGGRFWYQTPNSFGGMAAATFPLDPALCQNPKGCYTGSMQTWDIPAIRALLDHLADGAPRDGEKWRGWRIAPVTGGRNNLLYRATGAPGDLAIKFTVRDERDRVGREFGSLSALRQAGLSIAPEPVLLDRSRYPQPVVVQSWLEGEVCATAPTKDAEWEKVAQHLASIHTVTPDRTAQSLPWATINANDAKEGKQRVRAQVAHIPAEARSPGLRALLRRFEAAQFPAWPKAPVTLCRLDNNIENYIRRPGQWASVDWEYSGWGDPAFEVANLVTHVAMMEVPPSRWAWFVERSCDLMEDESAPLRIGVYCEIMRVWWVARLARYLYELPRGRDRRLADWPDGWQADIERKYAHYLALVEDGQI